MFEAEFDATMLLVETEYIVPILLKLASRQFEHLSYARSIFPA